MTYGLVRDLTSMVVAEPAIYPNIHWSVSIKVGYNAMKLKGRWRRLDDSLPMSDTLTMEFALAPLRPREPGGHLTSFARPTSGIRFPPRHGFTHHEVVLGAPGA